jgi:LmbE family N-acetylglucosaminyl deacetylase
MTIFAHPDDESLGSGGTLAKYSAEGVETYVVCATRGERGWNGDEKDNPGLAGLGQIREGELRAATRILGARETIFLDYIDGDLDQADPTEAIAKIVGEVRRVRPQVVITFAPDGAYGHPDHIAISQFTQAALVCAADAGYAHPAGAAPQRVSKLYYIVDSKELQAEYRALTGENISMEVDGVQRQWLTWEDWAITTRIDAEAHWQTAWRAIACHRSQLPDEIFNKLANMPEEGHRRVWGRQSFYRVYSLVNGGRKVEQDLFEGL